MFRIYFGLLFMVFQILFGVGHSIPPPGTYPDPENCRNFYECDLVQCYLKTCAEGDLFDAAMTICNFAYMVDCGDRPNPYDPTRKCLNLIPIYDNSNYIY